VRPLRTTDLESDPERIFESSGLMVRNVMQIAWLESAWRHLAETGTRAFVDGSNGNFTLTLDGLRGLSDLFRTGRWLRLASYVVLRGLPNPRAGLRDVWRNVVIPSVPPSMRRVRWQDNSSLRGDAATAFDVVGRMQRRGNDPSWVGAQSSLQDRIIRIKRNRVFFAEYHSWMSAKYGVEPRFPLMDVRMIDFCLSVPVHVYLHDGRPRALARDLLVAARLPRAFAERQARGRMCPEWFARLERRRPKIETEIAAIRKLPLAAKMIDFERIDRIMADWPADAESAKSRNLELDILLTRALHVGAFIGWAEKGPSMSTAVQM